MDHFWYENAIFYGVDVRRYQDSNGDGFGDLPGLINRLDYIQNLGVDALWLLPIYDSPLKDNGYDVRDYFRLDPRVGTLEDFTQLVTETRKRNMHLMIDLVMNHTSNEHPWFQASCRDAGSRYRNYYVWTNTIPKETMGGGPVFPGMENSVWTYDHEARAYYYHRFFHFQPGLRVANPAVQEEIFNVLDFWLSMGVDGFRIDAAPIMLETKGLPDTHMHHPHRLFENMHDFLAERRRDTVLLGEVDLPLQRMDKFFGGGSEMNMLFNFQIAPHIMLALAEQDAGPIYDYLRDALIPPANDQWLNFLRHHDELTLGMLPERQREEIFKVFAPQESMRIFGRGIRRRIAPTLSEGCEEINWPVIELAFSLLFATPGTPMVFYGDEIGMGDDLSLEGRTAVRTPMQWNGAKNAGFSTADDLIAPVIDDELFDYRKINVAVEEDNPDSFLTWMKDMIACRKAFPAIGLCQPIILNLEEGGNYVIALYYGSIPGREGSIPLVLFHNLSPQERTVTACLPEEHHRTAQPVVKLGRGEQLGFEEGQLTVKLPGFGYLWVQA